MKRNLLTLACALALALAGNAIAHEPGAPPATHVLGHLDFPTSTKSPQAQAAFTEGMAWTPLTLERRASIRTANGGGASCRRCSLGTAAFRPFRPQTWQCQELPETHQRRDVNERPTSISPAARR